MPALPTVPNVLKAKLKWSVSTDVLVSTTLFFSYSGPAPDNAGALSFATTFATAFAAPETLWDKDTTFLGCEVIDLSSVSGGVGEHDESSVGNLQTPISGASCVLLNYQIARRYRGGRPRSYFPFGDASVVGNRQTWEGTFIASVESNMAAAFAACIGATAGSTTITNHVNVSYYDGFTVVTNPISGRARNVPKLRTTPVVDTISSFSVSTRIANQRRRG